MMFHTVTHANYTESDSSPYKTAFRNYNSVDISPNIDPYTADTWNGDPQDCKLPNSFQEEIAARAPFATMSTNARALAVGEAIQNMTSELQDYARLHSVWDIATHDAFAIARDPALADPSETGLEGYFRVVVYSSRLLNTTCPALGLTTFDSCITRADPSNGDYWNVLSPSGEDAGGPGDRVAIGVDFNHPLITPFLMTAWPYVHLTTIREGIVENFRTSKTINVAAPIGWATWTPSNTPTITNTPTNTKTNTPTDTPTPTDTNTPTETMTPSNTYTPTNTMTPTPTLGCGLLSANMSFGPVTYVFGSYRGSITGTITNNNPQPVTYSSMNFIWPVNTGQYVRYVTVNGTQIVTASDTTPPTDYFFASSWVLPANSTHTFSVDFRSMPSVGFYGTYTMTFNFVGGCDASVTISNAEPTNTPTKTPTITLTPSKTNTPTNTLTPSLTPTYTLTPTKTNTPTITQTPSRTPTPTITPTRTNTATITNTPSRTPTNTFTITMTPSNTLTPSQTYTPSNTSTITPTASKTSTKTSTNTLTPSNTPTNTLTPSKTNTFTLTPTKTNTPTVTSSPTLTSSPTATKTFTPSATMTPSPTFTKTPTPTKTPTATWCADC